MTDCDFLEELADQIEDVGVSCNAGLARQVRQVASRLKAPGGGLVERRQGEVAWNREREAQAKWNRAAHELHGVVAAVDQVIDRVSTYLRTGVDPASV